ncbi:hypothetical protein GCM10023144_05980 [Pigmentiphaga soli]|uniref:NADH:flavin oxidoreductase/NADH oxidase N-terminal domain-containing protein n=1 Tax=Pigmentiphaga soli TaxID=1007095 RepID=A0ABP8GHP2_9BURK
MDPLFQPGQIGTLQLRNRIVMAPMTTRLATADGHVTDATIAYFRARAAGGAGLLTVEMASPERVGRHRAHELGIHDDRFLPGLARLTGVLHEHGAKVSIQLGHAGGHTRADICGETPIAPSALPHHVYEGHGETIVPLAMDRARIEQTIAAFVDAAARARRAGFDCVELHAAHGYLLSQFLCPAENRRDDEYGGSLENRARIGLRIVRGIKERLPGFPVIYRLSADDLFDGGLRADEAEQVAQWAAQAGADAIHVSAAHYRSQPSAELMIPPMAFPEGVFLPYAQRIRRRVGVPVIAVGRLGSPAVARAALAEGRADFIALGRSLLADPDWPAKVLAGRPVRRCVACNTCVNDMRGGSRLLCLVNPAAADETRFPPGGASVRGERICVVGAGPAGLSYALLAAPANRVTVLERGLVAGGALRQAGKAPRFQDVAADESALRRYAEELAAACRDAGVDLQFGVDVRREPARLQGYDRIVVATGARYRFGLGWLARAMLERGWARSRLARGLFESGRLRDWLYYRARRPTGAAIARLAAPGQRVDVIGDAARAGKSRDAILSGYRAAYGEPPAAGRG